MPFVLVEEQVGGQVWAGPAASHQHRNAPGHDQVQRNSALQAVDRPQLQGLDPAAVLEDVEEEASRPEEFHLRPLTERCVNLSIHTAPIKQTHRPQPTP